MKKTNKGRSDPLPYFPKSIFIPVAWMRRSTLPKFLFLQTIRKFFWIVFSTSCDVIGVESEVKALFTLVWASVLISVIMNESSSRESSRLLCKQWLDYCRWVIKIFYFFFVASSDSDYDDERQRRVWPFLLARWKSRILACSFSTFHLEWFSNLFGGNYAWLPNGFFHSPISCLEIIFSFSISFVFRLLFYVYGSLMFALLSLKGKFSSQGGKLYFRQLIASFWFN